MLGFHLFYSTRDEYHWIITNPPYSSLTCLGIAQEALRYSKIGVALLLRLSFLEPTRSAGSRGDWLKDNPPDRLIVLPRYSYTRNGKTDSVTTAWHIWLKNKEEKYNNHIICAHKADKML